MREQGMTLPGAHVTSWHSRLQDPCPWKSLYHLKPQADTVLILRVEFLTLHKADFYFHFTRNKKKKINLKCQPYPVI